MLPRKKTSPSSYLYHRPKRILGNARIVSVTSNTNGTSYQITLEWFIRLDIKESTACSFDTTEPDDKKKLEKLCSYAEVSDPSLLVGKLVRLVYSRDSINYTYAPVLIGHIFENDFFNVFGLKFESNCFELI